MPRKVSYRKDHKNIYPYKWGLEIILTNDVWEYATRNSMFCPPATAAFHHAIPEKCRSIVVLPVNGTYGLIVHEAYHVMCAVYRYCGVKGRDEESAAYFLEDVVEDIIESIDRMKKKKVRYLRSK